MMPCMADRMYAWGQDVFGAGRDGAGKEEVKCETRGILKAFSDLNRPRRILRRKKYVWIRSHACPPPCACAAKLHICLRSITRIMSPAEFVVIVCDFPPQLGAKYKMMRLEDPDDSTIPELDKGKANQCR